MFPACFKISPVLRKKHCYCEITLQKLREPIRRFWGLVTAAKTKRQKMDLLWVMESIRCESNYSHCGKLGVCIPGRPIWGFLACGMVCRPSRENVFLLLRWWWQTTWSSWLKVWAVSALFCPTRIMDPRAVVHYNRLSSEQPICAWCFVAYRICSHRISLIFFSALLGR